MKPGRSARLTSRSLRWLFPFAASMTALVVAAVCLTGCGDDKKPDEPTPPTPKRYPAPVSPDSVIAAFEQAYIDKNFDEYFKLFDRDLFTFAFAQVDLDQNPDLAPTWDWRYEFDSAQSLFSTDIVHDIRCDLSARDAAVPATEDDQLGFSSENLANTKRVRIRQAWVEIDTIDQQGGPLTLQVDGDAQEFFIKVYLGELIHGLPRHRIVYWKDKGIQAGGGGGFARGVVGSSVPGIAATDATTWGSIKNLFER